MIKITFLTGEYPPMQGGIADHIAYLAGQMASLEIESSILIQRRWLETAEAGTLTQPRIFPIIPGWGWRCWPAVTSFLKTHRPAVLHVQYQAAAFDLGGWINWLPWYLKQRRVCPRLVTTFHDLRQPYIFPKAGPLRWRSILALARYSDAVICTNREDLQTLQQALGARAVSLPLATAASRLPGLSTPLLTLIPLGSNVEPQPPADFDRTAWRQRYRAGEQTLLLAYFGFLNESKGGEELIEALAWLRQHGLEVGLLLIGGDVGHADPTNVIYARRVRSLIDNYGLADSVHFTGYTDLAQVSANLLSADVVVMPYRDGVSFRRTTLIAALRHGCPVVSTSPANAALVPEIQPGENMLLAPPGDAVALARTILPLAGDTVLRQKLAAGARQLGQLFKWTEIAGRTAALYQAIISANQ